MRWTNNTKKGHQQWMGCGHIAVHRQVSHPLPLDDLCGQLQSPSITVLGGAEFTSLRFFFIVLVVSFLEFRCAFEVSLFISFFFYIRYLLSLL
jgi:hypothetical protein